MVCWPRLRSSVWTVDFQDGHVGLTNDYNQLAKTRYVRSVAPSPDAGATPGMKVK